MNGVSLSTFILAFVRVAEAEGRPLTVDDVASALGVPGGELISTFDHLVATGSIFHDGEYYRYDVSRPPHKKKSAR